MCEAGTCKCLSAFTQSGCTVLVGDGRSDFCVAAAADVVFAKDKLAEHCRLAGIPFRPLPHLARSRNGWRRRHPHLLSKEPCDDPCPRRTGALPAFGSRRKRRGSSRWRRAYCSHGDTVHYSAPKIFDRCEGSYLYDAEGLPYLDLQMLYSAVNFGYGNPRLNRALTRQLNRLPQVASQYLHAEKIELAALIAQRAEATWGAAGRVHFNVGGSQAVEDALKLVRNAKRGKSTMFAFEGGYHGRTLGASAITSSYRYRRRYGHFDRALFVPFP